jgi:hypothetical protein
MTPQEKAKELFDKFHFVNSESVELESGDYELLFSLHESDAKKCSLIALEEILDALKFMPYGIQYLSARDYFEEVKEELEKL